MAYRIVTTNIPEHLKCYENIKVIETTMCNYSKLLEYQELALKYDYPLTIFEKELTKWANLMGSFYSDKEIPKETMAWTKGNFTIIRIAFELDVMPYSQKSRHMEAANELSFYGICGLKNCKYEGENVEHTQVCKILGERHTSFQFATTTMEYPKRKQLHQFTNEEVKPSILLDIMTDQKNYCYYCNTSLLEIHVD